MSHVIKMIWIVILLLCHHIRYIHATETFIASFQPNVAGPSLATNDVWLELSDPIPSTKEFTACKWILIKYFNFKYAGCLWSYCTKETKDQKKELCMQVCLQADKKSLERDIILRGRIQLSKKVKRESIVLIPNFFHRTWVHICWSFSIENGESKWYYNGKLLKDEIFDVNGFQLAIKDSNKMYDSAFIFGQEPDALRGGFEVAEAFLGDTAELNIWNYVMKDDEILSLATCKSLMKGNVVAWETSSFINHNVVLTNVSDAYVLCSGYNKYVVFTEMLRFPEAKSTCEIHGGNLAVPKSDKENQMVIDLVYTHEKSCIINGSNDGNIVWVGAKKVNGKWYEVDVGTNVKPKPLNYTYNYGSSSLHSDCSSLSDDGSWVAGTYSCTLFSMCFVCYIPTQPVFTIKGTCSIGEIDRNYYLALDDLNSPSHYEGYKKTNYHFDNKVWNITTKIGIEQTFNVITSDNRISPKFPIGRKKWLIDDPSCRVQNEIREMTLSTCKFPFQFTCDTGHCVDINKRCDENEDCTDASDEKNCPLISIPPNYNKANAPKPSKNDDKLDVLIETVIRNIDSIDTLHMTVTLTLEIHLLWRDRRLTFTNPKVNKTNLIPAETSQKLWNPLLELVHENAVIGEILYTEDSTVKLHATVPEELDPSKAVENRMFSGSHNPLELTQRMKVKYNCLFNVRNFPFDVNNCSFIMKINERKAGLIRFVDEDDIAYDGPQIVESFTLGEMTRNIVNTDKVTKFTFVIPLHRVFTNQLINTFLPTIILWLFGYATLFIDLDNPSDRFMGSGTALLVIATLISMITGALPKTSYLKLIDIWLIWHFVFVFLMIWSNVLVDRVRIRRKDSKKTQKGKVARNMILPFLTGDLPFLNKEPLKNQEKRLSQTIVLPFNGNEMMKSSNPDDELEVPVQNFRKLSNNDEDLMSDVMSVIDYRPKNVKQDYFKPSNGENAKKINSVFVIGYPIINVLFYITYFYLTIYVEMNEQ